MRGEAAWTGAGLVVEDNQVVAQAVAEGLRDEGFAVNLVGDGESGLAKAALAP